MDDDDGPDGASRRVKDQPPEPPALAIEHVEALIAWMDDTIEWLQHDEAEARKHGHEPSAQSAAVIRIYEDSALLLREAYDLAADE